MEFGREMVAEHLVKNNMPTSAKLKKAFEEFVDDDWIAKDLEKCHERIMELRDKTLLVEFARKMSLLLAENGVKVVGNIVNDMSFDEESNIYFGKSELDIEHLDFSEHDKPFEDKIAKLENRVRELEMIHAIKIDEVRKLTMEKSELKSELESKIKDDLPFDALETANYLINSTYERESSSLERAFAKVPDKVNDDRYTVDELEQIAEHLLIYCKHNKECEE